MKYKTHHQATVDSGQEREAYAAGPSLIHHMTPSGRPSPTSSLLPTHTPTTGSAATGETSLAIARPHHLAPFDLIGPLFSLSISPSWCCRLSNLPGVHGQLCHILSLDLCMLVVPFALRYPANRVNSHHPLRLNSNATFSVNFSESYWLSYSFALLYLFQLYSRL